MPTPDTETIAQQVHEQCNVPVEFETVLGFVKQLHGDFDVEPDVLIQKSASALEQRYEENIVAQGGFVVEFEDGEIIGIV